MFSSSNGTSSGSVMRDSSCSSLIRGWWDSCEIRSRCGKSRVDDASPVALCGADENIAWGSAKLGGQVASCGCGREKCVCEEALATALLSAEDRESPKRDARLP